MMIAISIRQVITTYAWQTLSKNQTTAKEGKKERISPLLKVLLLERFKVAPFAVRLARIQKIRIASVKYSDN